MSDKSSNGTVAETKPEVKDATETSPTKKATETSPAKVGDAKKEATSPVKKAKVEDVKKEATSPAKEAKVEDVKKEAETTKRAVEDAAEKSPSKKPKLEDEKEAEKKEVKSETNEPANDSEKKIIRQIEYYFGNVNLAKDKFLQSLIKEDEGWVALETMLKFNRLKELSDDVAVIATALEKATSDLMQVNDEHTKIRRNPLKPMPENNQERMTDLKKRSLYVKGFPIDATLEDLMTFFDGHGGSEHIAMRREAAEAGRTFKGSVFVIFNKPADAKKFVEAEEIKYKEEAEGLTKLLKDDYFKRKQDDRRKQKEEEHSVKEEAKKANEEAEREKQKERITKGALLEVTGMPDGLKMNELKEKFGEWGTVMWVDLEDDDKLAKVRYDGEDSAKAAKEKAEKDAKEKAEEGKDEVKVTINNTEVTLRIMEGEEETKHWTDFFAQLSQRASGRGRFGRGRGRGGRGGRGGKRFGGRNQGGPSSKRSKTD